MIHEIEPISAEIISAGDNECDCGEKGNQPDSTQNNDESESVSSISENLREPNCEECESSNTSITGKPLHERHRLIFGEEPGVQGISETDQRLLDMWAERIRTDPSSIPSHEDEDYLKSIFERT